MTEQCREPQSHPERCGCDLKHPSPHQGQWGGITIIRNDMLPEKTMIVSPDVFEILKGAPRR